MADFRDAFAYMQEHGMTKGELEDVNGAVCALGACAAVGVWSGTLIDAVARELYPDRVHGDEEEVGLRYTAQVNDHPETTLDDIRVIFEKAQLRLDEQV